MRKIYFFVAVLLFAGGIFSAYAEDKIVLMNGNVILARVVTEVSSSRIKFENYGGQMTFVPASSVQSIRYQDGKVETLNDPPPPIIPPPPKRKNPITNQPNTPASSPNNTNKSNSSKQGKLYVMKPETAMDPDDMTFGASTDLSGFLPLEIDNIDVINGPALNAEFTIGNLNAQINISLPQGFIYGKDDFGFGIGLCFNYFYHTRIGGFYVGGIGGYSYASASDEHKGVLALSIGYKFVFSSGMFSGMYFRTGANVGAFLTSAQDKDPVGFVIRPDLSMGYNF